MAKARSPDWEKIKEDYIKLNGEVKLKEFAEKHGVKYSTLRSRKNREKWNEQINTVATKNKEVTAAVDKLKENNELTDMQKMFCIYYIKYFNATKAAKKAGYSKKYASEIGYQLLQKTTVQDEIKRLKAEKFRGAFLEEGDLLQKYIDIAFADMTDFIEFGKREVPIKDSTGRPRLNYEGKEMTQTVNYINFKNDYEVDGTIISEVSQGKDGIKVKLQDKMKALDFLAKHIGLLSVQDQARVESERTKTQKLQLEIDKISGDKEGQEAENWVKAIQKIAAKRKKESDKNE